MKKIGELFRGPGEEQRFVCEIGESELRKLELANGLPGDLTDAIARFSRAANYVIEAMTEAKIALEKGKK